MDFLNISKMFSFLSFSNTPGGVSACQIFLCLMFFIKKLYHKIQFYSHFVEFTEEQVLKSFSGRNNSPEPPAFI